MTFELNKRVCFPFCAADKDFVFINIIKVHYGKVYQIHNYENSITAIDYSKVKTSDKERNNLVCKERDNINIQTNISNSIQ